MPTIARSSAKKATNLSIREDLLTEARAAGINLSQTLEIALETAVRASREARWRKENAEAFAAYNGLIEAEGLPLEAWRMF